MISLPHSKIINTLEIKKGSIGSSDFCISSIIQLRAKLCVLQVNQETGGLDALMQ